MEIKYLKAYGACYINPITIRVPGAITNSGVPLNVVLRSHQSILIWS